MRVPKREQGDLAALADDTALADFEGMPTSGISTPRPSPRG